jgi:hypothetical protein
VTASDHVLRGTDLAVPQVAEKVRFEAVLKGRSFSHALSLSNGCAAQVLYMSHPIYNNDGVVKGILRRRRFGFYPGAISL